MDWNEPKSWPEPSEADLILGTLCLLHSVIIMPLPSSAGADILYHGHGHAPLANLLKHLLSGPGSGQGDPSLPKFALFVEPIHEERVTATDGQQFAEVAQATGLDVHVTRLDGPRAMQQIIVTAKVAAA